jgi:medium-chain acyl-[acyl-carrier-protein] hydrolase
LYEACNDGVVHIRESNLWCVAARPNPHASMRLVCFPYAGASASLFRSWHHFLPQNIEVYGIQLPGRRNRISEPPFTSMPSLVAELGMHLLPLLDRPFAFFGHSVGALVAFEMARWLRRRRASIPQFLFVSGRRAPQVRDTGPILQELNDNDFLTGICRLNGLHEDILANPEALQLVLPALRADSELCETYNYVSEAPLPCSIVGCCGADDAEETVLCMDEWYLQTTRDFSLHVLPGDHFFIHSSEGRLLELLAAQL